MWQIFRVLKSSVGTTQRIGETLRQQWVWRGLPEKWGTEAEGHMVSLQVCSHARPGQQRTLLPPPSPASLHSASSPRSLVLKSPVPRPQVPGPSPSLSASLPRGAVWLFHRFVFQTLCLLFYVEQKFRLLISYLSVSTFV